MPVPKHRESKSPGESAVRCYFGGFGGHRIVNCSSTLSRVHVLSAAASVQETDAAGAPCCLGRVGGGVAFWVRSAV